MERKKWRVELPDEVQTSVDARPSSEAVTETVAEKMARLYPDE
jgi:hypothetical protein